MRVKEKCVERGQCLFIFEVVFSGRLTGKGLFSRRIFVSYCPSPLGKLIIGHSGESCDHTARGVSFLIELKHVPWSKDFRSEKEAGRITPGSHPYAFLQYALNMEVSTHCKSESPRHVSPQQRVGFAFPFLGGMRSLGCGYSRRTVHGMNPSRKANAALR